MRFLSRQNGLALMATLVAGACATSTPAERMQAAEAQPLEDQAAVELRDHHRHHHRGGTMQFVAMSLDTLGPEDAKRPQVERIQRDLYVCIEPTGELNRQLQLAVADGVAAGAIDAVKVDAIIGELEATIPAAQGCGAGALAQLYAILSPEERAELVEKVQAHFEVWREVNEDGAMDRRPGRLGELTREVRLTPDQVGRIEAGLHLVRGGRGGTFDHAKAEANMQRFALTFSSDSFDARAVAGGADAGVAAQGANRMAVFYETVAPILTSSQRATLSEHLRERAGHHPTLSAN